MSQIAISLFIMTFPFYAFLVAAEGERHFTNIEGTTHIGITCNECESDVETFQYMCLQCPDYNLCRSCEAKGLHAKHNMMRISSPGKNWSQHNFEELNVFYRELQEKAKNKGAVMITGNVL